jgi:Amt family ammonium transporter
MGRMVAYRDVRSRRQSEARPRRSALHDGLTGLANRALFLDRLTLTLARQQRRPERRFASVLLGVDGLRQVNERLGHAAGDAVLLAVAARLKGCLRPHDTIARFGGGEFGLLLDEAGSPDDVAGVVERILRAVERPVDVGGAEVEVRVSLGVALSVDGWIGAEAMILRAEQAMDAERGNGGVGHALYAEHAGAVCQMA